jgi:RNA polymerase sigma factor (sigma-70 family)
VQRETNLGGERRDFPQTRRSLVARIGAGEPAERRAAQGELIATYWKPVYAYLRLRWRHDNERAKDATQGFFAAVIEKHWLADFDPARARFRAYLRACVDRFVANEERARAAQRRGGDVAHVELDFDGAESELGRRDPPDPNTLDAWFENEWRRSVLAGALADLERECEARGQRTRFEAFRRYDVEPGSASERPTYDELARELGLKATDVTNYLHAVRKRLRQVVLLRLREVTATDEEFKSEAVELLGIDPDSP